ncbi:endonuclease/exonuclease/phosphatase family protein [Dokdonella sp.]|uniref:endonuclease/exonuclease/phosphatase family protein n=1 Tax=Dokdonella sp. TaxID=2291710 RepID=UPI0031BBF0A1|nr:endonuclease/exonuclease/phosphatase family protein [Dokdonella sp.]
MSTRLRVATWNIHRGVGLDGRFAPERVARVIEELDADVIALQEVGSRRTEVDMQRHLADALGHGVHFVATCTDRHGEFGNALLSRLPLASSACQLLGVPGREPRNAIDAVLDADGRQLRVVATHLGLLRSERDGQVRRLADLLAGNTLPLLVMGDFNAWRGRMLRGLGGGAPAAPRTFPSPFPVAALDRILVSPPAVCRRLLVHRSRLSRVASDHLPLVGELEIP